MRLLVFCLFVLLSVVCCSAYKYDRRFQQRVVDDMDEDEYLKIASKLLSYIEDVKKDDAVRDNDIPPVFMSPQKWGFHYTQRDKDGYESE